MRASDLPNKVLVPICKQIIKKTDWELNGKFYETCVNFLKFAGVDADYLDVDFIYNLIDWNNFDNENIYNELIRPELTNMEIIATEQVTVYRTNYYEDNVKCYSYEKDNKEELFKLMKEYEDYNIYENQINSEDDDYETTDWDEEVR